MDPEAVQTREVRVAPVGLYVQLHKPEDPLLMVLRDGRKEQRGSFRVGNENVCTFFTFKVRFPLVV